MLDQLRTENSRLKEDLVLESKMRWVPLSASCQKLRAELTFLQRVAGARPIVHSHFSSTSSQHGVAQFKRRCANSKASGAGASARSEKSLELFPRQMPPVASVFARRLRVSPRRIGRVTFRLFALQADQHSRKIELEKRRVAELVCKAAVSLSLRLCGA